MFRREAAILLLAGALSCTSSHHQDSPYTVRQPLPPAPDQAPGPALLRVLHFGDFGEQGEQQRAVAAAMAGAHQRAPFDQAWAVGDNIYECGPDPSLDTGAGACAFGSDDNTIVPGYSPPIDPLFRDSFEDALAPLVAGAGPPPLHVLLGNHDVGTGGACAVGDLPARELARQRACLEVAHRSPAWLMPGRHYVVDQGPARFIAIDSNVLARDYGGFTLEQEVEFVRASAAECESRLCFLLAHHPPATAGSHGSELDATTLARVAQLDQAAGGGISAWLVGHDHDLQHLRTPAGQDVLVSGSSSQARLEERFGAVMPAGADLLFATSGWGYGILAVSADGWRYWFEDERGQAIHCCQALGRGPCVPVRCEDGP